MHALVSIHDVMPATLDALGRSIRLVRQFSGKNVCLLVVPGPDWHPEQIELLKKWQDDGFEIVGHGWQHRAPSIRTVKHKLHSAFISGNVAEHLSLETEQIQRLINDSFNWFDRNGFWPQLYVPPAWAMGKISRSKLKELPFQYYEFLSGLFDKKTEKFVKCPLAGFEADRVWRERFLRCWNWVNQSLGTKNQPVRISIHPYDLQYRMASQIPLWLEQVDVFVDYRDLFTS